MAGPNSWHGRSAPPTRFRSKFARQSPSDFLERTLGRDCDLGIIAAGRVHEHRRRSQRGLDASVRLSQLPSSLASHEKNARCPPLSVMALHARFASLRIAAQHRDFRARPGQPFRQRAAQHARRADDDRHFACKIE